MWVLLLGLYPGLQVLQPKVGKSLKYVTKGKETRVQFKIDYYFQSFCLYNMKYNLLLLGPLPLPLILSFYRTKHIINA